MKHRSSEKRGFEIKEGGEWRRLSDHVRVASYYSVDNSQQKYAEVEIWDMVGEKVIQTTVPFETFHQPRMLIKALASTGFKPPAASDKEVLAQCLQSARPITKHRVSKIGWYVPDKCYALTNETIGSPDAGTEIVEWNGTNSCLIDYSVRGTLEEWKEHVAKPCGYSSRAVTAICAALAAVTVEPTGYENFGLHYFGETSFGKSTLLLAARSVAGLAVKDKLFTWDNTDAGFEEIAAASNSNALITDEGQLANKSDTELVKKARQRAYQFVQGRSRTRSQRFQINRTGTNLAWNGVLLSAGEDSFWSLASKSEDPRRGGELHRLIDLPAFPDPGNTNHLGIFEKVPDGFRNTAEAADAITNACGRFYGQPLREFVRRWIDAGPEATRRLEEKKIHFLTQAGLNNSGGWEKRFADRFATIYAAGSMAHSWRILPWDNIGLSVLRCYRAARDVLDEQFPQPTKLLDEFRQKIAETLVEEKSEPPVEKTVRKQAADASHPARILVRGFRIDEWFFGAERELLLQHIEERGFLMRKNGRHCRTVQVRVGNGEKLDYYAFNPTILKVQRTTPKEAK